MVFLQHSPQPHTPPPISAVQKKIKHEASVMAMCLRSVHSLHLHFVQAFRSFRCTSFTTLSFTPFRLRSFHPPQHRTAKVAHSFRCTNPRSSIPLHSIATFASAHRTLNIGMLFFLRHIAPTNPHTNIPFKMVNLSHGTEQRISGIN